MEDNTPAPDDESIYKGNDNPLERNEKTRQVGEPQQVHKEENADEKDSDWVFIESGWFNMKHEVSDKILVDPSNKCVDSFPLVNQIESNFTEKRKVTGPDNKPEQFLDFLQPHTIPASLDDLLLPAKEFYDATIIEMKPENIPMLSNKPLDKAKLASGWEYEAGVWFNPDANNENLLDSAGRPVPSHNAVALTPAVVAGAEMELSERKFPFNSDYLMEMKPISLPIAIDSEEAFTRSNRTTDCEKIELPAPEVELLSADQFVCVMTYDAENQQIVCGMPAFKDHLIEETVENISEEENLQQPSQQELDVENVDSANTINHVDVTIVNCGEAIVHVAEVDENKEEKIPSNQSKQDEESIIQQSKSIVGIEISDEHENSEELIPSLETARKIPLKEQSIAEEDLPYPQSAVVLIEDNSISVAVTAPHTPSTSTIAQLLPKTTVDADIILGITDTVEMVPNPDTNRTNESAADHIKPKTDNSPSEQTAAVVPAAGELSEETLAEPLDQEVIFENDVQLVIIPGEFLI